MIPNHPRENENLIYRPSAANAAAVGQSSFGSEGKKEKIKERLTSIDIFRKYTMDAPKDLAKRTKLGAVWSIIVVGFLLFLFTSECLSFWRVRREDLLSVDKRPEGKLDIYFNITFPHVKCMDLTVDSIDVSGEAQIDIQQNVFKRVVDSNGKIIEVLPQHNNAPENMLTNAYDPQGPISACGKCGDFRSAQQCCLSCHDVLNFYRVHDMTPPPLEHIDQCIEEASVKYPGCNMFGVLRTNKVSGNFHFAPGRSFSRPQETRVHHIHEYDPILISRFNTSHVVHSLSFGQRIPHVEYPMDNVESIVPSGMGLHKYFIKIVPTEYKSGWTLIDSYQFSYTQHGREFSLQQGIMLPGVFFVFELSPIMISYREYRFPFLHFLVRVFAIIGGVFTVSGMVNRMVHSSIKKLSKKLE